MSRSDAHRRDMQDDIGEATARIEARDKARSPVVDIHRVIPEDEHRALVALETTERLMKEAMRLVSDPTEFNLRLAKHVLWEAIGETTSRTCTAIKTQALSDEVSRAARHRVGPILTRAEAACRYVEVPGLNTSAWRCVQCGDGTPYVFSRAGHDLLAHTPEETP